MLDEIYYEKRQETLQNILHSLSEAGYDFCRLDRQHRELYLKYEPRTALSWRCFPNQYAYAEEDCIYFWEDREDQCLLVLYLDKQNQLCAYPPMFREYTPERFAAAIEKYRGIFIRLELPLRFGCADEEDVKRFSQLPYAQEISAPEQDADYIYEFSQLKDFGGGQNANRRRKRNHFLNCHSATLEPIQAGDTEESLGVLSAWCTAYKCSDSTHRCPRDVAIRLLDAMEELHIIGFLLRVDKEAQALILLGPMSPDMLDVLTICSVNREMGLEEAFYAMVAEEISPLYQYMNLEEDMGIEGLRTHKQSMRPCLMQKKYFITLS